MRYWEPHGCVAVPRDSDGTPRGVAFWGETPAKAVLGLTDQERRHDPHLLIVYRSSESENARGAHATGSPTA